MTRLPLICSLLLALAVPAHAELVCGKDLDGDTFFDGAGELRACVNGICPHDTAVCTVGTPGCTGGAMLNLDRDTCQLPSTGACLPGYQYVPLPVDLCEQPITCAQGPYDPVTNTCPSVWDCPLGGQYGCGDMGAGTPRCSPFACANPATSLDEAADTSTFTNDGTVNAAGGCTGTWLIFNGKGMECLPPGWKTSFFNCCDTDEGSFLFIRENCSAQAYEVALAREAGRTHYIGSYCKKKVTLIGCVQRAKVYCVFNSKMGRIIQEGCRPQLTDFGPSGGWGSAKRPNCVGLTPEQFQSCDFGKIDFAEMQEEFTPNLGTVAPDIQGAIDGYLQNLR